MSKQLFTCERQEAPGFRSHDLSLRVKPKKNDYKISLFFFSISFSHHNISFRKHIFAFSDTCYPVSSTLDHQRVERQKGHLLAQSIMSASTNNEPKT